jgi:hypothetical protein
MIFSVQNPEDYPIQQRINNMQSLLSNINKYYQQNINSDNNTFIDGYLRSSEYILYRLFEKLKNNELDKSPFDV